MAGYDYRRVSELRELTIPELAVEHSVNTTRISGTLTEQRRRQSVEPRLRLRLRYMPGKRRDGASSSLWGSESDPHPG